MEHVRKTPAEVIGNLASGVLRVVIARGLGLVDAGIECDVPAEIVPVELRRPAMHVWVEVDGRGEILRVWERKDNGGEKVHRTSG